MTIDDLDDIVQLAVGPLEDSRLSIKNLPAGVDPDIISILNEAREILTEAADIMYDAKRAAK